MDNKFCSKCNSPNVFDKWGDGKYYCLFHQPTEISDASLQEQPFYEQAREINFLIEFCKNLSWIEKNKHEAMKRINDDSWKYVQDLQGEILEKITKKIKKLLEEI